jgi:hypothetical protein
MFFVQLSAATLTTMSSCLTIRRRWGQNWRRPEGQRRKLGKMGEGGRELCLVKPSLHLRSLARYRGRNCARYRAVFTYLGHHVAQGGQGKCNTYHCHQHYHGHYHGRYRVTFANVNNPLGWNHRHKRKHRLLIGPALFWLSSYVTSHCLAVVPPSGANNILIVLFTT